MQIVLNELPIRVQTLKGTRKNPLPKLIKLDFMEIQDKFN